MRRDIEPEDIFLDSVKSMIKNMLIENPNYKTDYYYKDNGGDLLEDTKERAKYILAKIDEWEHLVKNN